MANLVRNIFKYSRDYLRSSCRLVHNEVKDKVETQVQKEDEDFSRRSDSKLTDPEAPLIVNFFEESPSPKKTPSDIWKYRSQELPRPSLPLREDLVRESRRDAANLRSELYEKERTWEQSTARLENVLIEIKSALEEMKRREAQASAAAHHRSAYLNHLRIMAAKIEREDKERRRFNILVVGVSASDEDATSRASELLEKYFNLRDCVASARVVGKRRDVLVVQLTSAEAKAEVTRNRALLKDTGILIRPDLTIGQRFLHRRLREIGFEAMKLGKSVKLGYTWVRIDDVKYYWNYRTDSLQPVDRDLTIG
ncbi:uncharacterized protein LOC107036511 [Diachasma alloeum]|uniref:uncharacterized protein LOC107036511 n=1 Tax=Diachasma alloeum TaxID=454923 RepID=UPI00073843A6|nr:uncharacterized protein LOC107036511 [Diachasma alloeum]